MLKYVKGDVTKVKPKEGLDIIIPHVVNDLGKMWSGVALALKNKWAKVYQDYKSPRYLELGTNQFVQVQEGIFVVNMIAQHDMKPESPKPIRYEALVQCMRDIRNQCDVDEIHAPKFGSDRAGGNWGFIVELIEEIWGDLNVTIYEL